MSPVRSLVQRIGHDAPEGRDNVGAQPYTHAFAGE